MVDWNEKCDHISHFSPKEIPGTLNNKYYFYTGRMSVSCVTAAEAHLESHDCSVIEDQRITFLSVPVHILYII